MIEFIFGMMFADSFLGKPKGGRIVGLPIRNEEELKREEEVTKIVADYLLSEGNAIRANYSHKQNNRSR